MPETGAPPPPVHSFDFGTPRGAAWAGIREALGAPALVLGASYVGFGSLVRETGFGLGLGLISTASTWALPGQVALVELYAAGASLLAIVIAVALTNARMLPMTLTLLPLLREPARPRWTFYLIAHLVAVTGWAYSMLRFPSMPPAQRLPYFVAFTVTLQAAAMLGTAIGFLVSAVVPLALSLGLVFVNPMNFLLLFLGDLRHRGRVLALVLGAAAAPLFHVLSPNWGLLLTGLLGGAAAFVLDRAIGRRHG